MDGLFSASQYDNTVYGIKVSSDSHTPIISSGSCAAFTVVPPNGCRQGLFAGMVYFDGGSTMHPVFVVLIHPGDDIRVHSGCHLTWTDDGILVSPFNGGTGGWYYVSYYSFQPF